MFVTVNASRTDPHLSSLLPLNTLAGTIKAHIAAGDKATSKAEEHYKAAGIHLKEAKERVKRTANLTWPAFLVSQCGIQRSRANELIQIADGRTSLEEVRERGRSKERSTREAARAYRHAGQSSGKTQSDQGERNTGPPQKEQIETPERMDVFDRIIAKLKNLDVPALREVENYLTENHDV